jgi:hypothetical protein
MLPATGILFSERLYLRIQLDLVKTESYQYPYFRADDGEIKFRILDGREQGCIVNFRGVGQNVVTATNSPAQLQFGGMNADTYYMSIKELSRNLTFNFTVKIFLNGTPSSNVISYINFNGTDYTTGDTIVISEE